MMKELSLQNCRIDGRYDIQDPLGRGSYAEIYTARDNLASIHSPHRLVVIKALNVFLQDDLDADLERTLVENFQNEAIALDRVRHPNIISRLGHGTARDLRGTVFHYLILEYLPGGDLAKMHQRRELSLADAFSYLEQVCAGLGHAHKCGIIHRDIKPQNLLLTEDKKIVKIADFGVARFSQSDSPITRVGTNMYAPPEHSPVFADSMNTMVVTELTPAADIYSLAKSAYVLITGESPRRFTNLPISDLPAALDDKPWGNDLLRVLSRATQSNPGERHQNVNDFWLELAKVKRLIQPAEPELETQVGRKIHTVPQALISADYSPKAPVLPQFKTSEDFKVPMTEEKNPHFVVRVPQDQVRANQFPKPVLNEKNQLQFDIPQAPPKAPNNLLKRAGIFVAFLLVFAGALFATQNYLRYGRIFPAVHNPLYKPEGVANSDVNLRRENDAESAKIGLVPRGSRVRVINSKDNWLEIDIIEFSRPKEAGDEDHGWVNKRYITIVQE
jgi:serine/threonine protein kinase